MPGYDQISHESLERAFDGPIPGPLRRALRAGSALNAARTEAEAEIGFLAAGIRDRLASIRLLRKSGASDATLCRDLATYRRAWRRWRKALAELDQHEAPPTAGGASSGWTCHRPVPDRA